MKMAEAASNFQGKAVPQTKFEYEETLNFQPDICQKTEKMVSKLKSTGKFGKSAVEHMTEIYAKEKKERTSKAFVIEIQSEQKKKQKVNLNKKSDKLVA